MITFTEGQYDNCLKHLDFQLEDHERYNQYVCWKVISATRTYNVWIRAELNDELAAVIYFWFENDEDEIEFIMSEL